MLETGAEPITIDAVLSLRDIIDFLAREEGLRADGLTLGEKVACARLFLEAIQDQIPTN